MIRTTYATIISLFALFCGFYAMMTLAFFFGENRSEWVFPVLITLIAALTIYTAVLLWMRKNAVMFTTISLIVFVALVGWIVIPPGTWDVNFIAIVIAWLAGIAMLLGLFSPNVRAALS